MKHSSNVPDAASTSISAPALVAQVEILDPERVVLGALTSYGRSE